jgi:hypothetical protein
MAECAAQERQAEPAQKLTSCIAAGFRAIRSPRLPAQAAWAAHRGRAHCYALLRSGSASIQKQWIEHVYGPGGQVLDGPKLRARMSKYNASCARSNGKRPSNLDNGASPSRPVGGKRRGVGKARSAAKERWSDEILTRTILDKVTASAAATVGYSSTRTEPRPLRRPWVPVVSIGFQKIGSPPSKRAGVVNLNPFMNALSLLASVSGC